MGDQKARELSSKESRANQTNKAGSGAVRREREERKGEEERGREIDMLQKAVG